MCSSVLLIFYFTRPLFYLKNDPVVNLTEVEFEFQSLILFGIAAWVGVRVCGCIWVPVSSCCSPFSLSSYPVSVLFAFPVKTTSC